MAKPRTNGTDSPTPPSTLDPDLLAESDREIEKGHGTEALGPSDTSDSGSDVQGGPGLDHEIGAGLGLDTGTTSDPDASTSTAGPDVGDANLDSDSDAEGTGERASAARDTSVRDGQDIDVDHIESIGEIENDLEEDRTPPPPRKKHR